MSDLSKSVGEILTNSRKAKKLRQGQMAQEVGVTQQCFSRYETGILELNYERLVYLCKRYDITPNDLFNF